MRDFNEMDMSSISKFRLNTPSTAHYVVIGIDFGTTFSGVSWTWSKAASPDQIECIHKWDGSGRNDGADKVPSKISYYQDGNVKTWGYTVGTNDELQAQWFKLLLSDAAMEQGGDRVTETKRMLQSLRKTPVDVVADYLRCLWKHAVEAIELALTKEAVDQMTFKVVLTIPANWDNQAEDLTKKAAIQAGITAHRLRGETTFKMVTEPEAAALAAWREAGMRWRPDLKMNDTFVVVDAGGGTVDLISYTVKSIDPLRLEMCVESAGDLCGAVYLDEAFDRVIRTYVGHSDYDKLSDAAKTKMFENDWEFGAKRKYDGQGPVNEEFKVDIPGYKPKKKGMFGKRPSSTITLTSDHIKQIFHPVIGRIVDLTRMQVEEVREKCQKSPKAVLLVGGFGENNFLLHRLKVTFPGITIQRPMRAWSVISRGAVIKGLSKSVQEEAVINFVSKLSYGVKYSAQFDPSKHLLEDKFTDRLTGRDMAKDQFKWYLKRGQSVSKLEPVVYDWRQLVRTIWDLNQISGTIWSSDLKQPPSRKSPNAREHCHIKCSFDEKIFNQLDQRMSKIGNIPYRELDYTLDMKAAGGELEWIIYWRDQQRGRAKVHVDYE